jgi:hypothetical protein
MRLSRSSDTRQRYRINGVRAGRFYSVHPQNDDPVYDTVKFNEVPSRLRRARGKFQLLPDELRHLRAAVRQECQRLAELCRDAALTLQGFLGAQPDKLVAIPTFLEKDIVFPGIKNSQFKGPAIGMARLSLRLTIKSVWDFPEMRERGIVPSGIEREQTIKETDTIIAIADKVLAR